MAGWQRRLQRSQREARRFSGLTVRDASKAGVIFGAGLMANLAHDVLGLGVLPERLSPIVLGLLTLLFAFLLAMLVQVIWAAPRQLAVEAREATERLTDYPEDRSHCLDPRGVGQRELLEWREAEALLDSAVDAGLFSKFSGNYYKLTEKGLEVRARRKAERTS